MEILQTVVITRPDTSAPFFYDTEYFQNLNLRAILDEYHANGSVVEYGRNISEDQLRFERYIIYKDETGKNDFEQAVALHLQGQGIDDFNSVKTDYFNTHNHIFSVEEIVLGDV